MLVGFHEWKTSTVNLKTFTLKWKKSNSWHFKKCLSGTLRGKALIFKINCGVCVYIYIYIYINNVLIYGNILK